MCSHVKVTVLVLHGLSVIWDSREGVCGCVQADHHGVGPAGLVPYYHLTSQESENTTARVHYQGLYFWVEQTLYHPKIRLHQIVFTATVTQCPISKHGL